jgi:long-chain acyl-CoA synthetase
VIGVDASDLEVVCKSEALKKAVLADFNKLATENKFSGLERIKQVIVKVDPFTIENDLLTPTQKIKRNVAQKVFQEDLDYMYTLPLEVRQ